MTINKVREFHKAFDHPVEVSPVIDNDLAQLRIRLLQEELDELSQAVDERNIVEVLDALTDIQYVLDGSYLTFGLADMKDDAFDEVHRSNMSKLGEDGNAIKREDGKILKGPNYFRPNLKKFFNNES